MIKSLTVFPVINHLLNPPLLRFISESTLAKNQLYVKDLLVINLVGNGMSANNVYRSILNRLGCDGSRYSSSSDFVFHIFYDQKYI